jgi:hypothetical protein
MRLTERLLHGFGLRMPQAVRVPERTPTITKRFLELRFLELRFLSPWE